MGNLRRALNIFSSSPPPSAAQVYKGYEDTDFIKPIEEWFELHAGVKPDFEAPKTFSEKIQWLKVYENIPLKAQLADKYDSRLFVKEKLGDSYLTSLYEVWTDSEDIDFNLLPDRFVLKCAHGGSWNLLVTDKSLVDEDEVFKNFDRYTRGNYAYFTGGYELQYRDLEPRILAEEYLENSADGLCEYKVWCFNGEPEYIQFVSERGSGKQMAFFDTNWELMPFIFNGDRVAYPVPKPEVLDDLLYAAKTICEGLAFTRVDFYLLNDGSLKFSEVDFTPVSGLNRWDPPEYDLIIGEKITLPEKYIMLRNKPEEEEENDSEEFNAADYDDLDGFEEINDDTDVDDFDDYDDEIEDED